MRNQLISIGVIIPTYNSVSQTVAAVESVLNQTMPVKQIVVVDDGSDESIYLELQRALTDKRVDLIRIKHSGHPGIAREAGRLRLNTEWIAFLDSDDTWRKNKVEVIFSNQIIYSAEAICSLASGSEHGNLIQRKTRSISRKELFKSNKIVNSTVVVRSQILDEIQGLATSYSVRGCEDYATWLRVSDKTKWLFVGEDLVRYNNDSEDSVRKDEEFRQDYSNITALLDYALYSKFRAARKFLFLRLALKHLWRLVE